MPLPLGREGIDLEHRKPLFLVLVHGTWQTRFEQVPDNTLIKLRMILSVAGHELSQDPQLLQCSVEKHAIGHQRVRTDVHRLGGEPPHLVDLLKNGPEKLGDEAPA